MGKLPSKAALISNLRAFGAEESRNIQQKVNTQHVSADRCKGCYRGQKPPPYNDKQMYIWLRWLCHCSKLRTDSIVGRCHVVVRVLWST
ncbi:hypothetical protein EYF80_026192 [Liparis tanakae]|uniref:Uncharacterized protein n=1 Tax=Liparis tanakae TaxID=230148 RepID=A0A4Z2HDE5_9TELE|nr:hypothetical protein EYF80_026192 [Liparis tanakae]